VGIQEVIMRTLTLFLLLPVVFATLIERVQGQMPPGQVHEQDRGVRETLESIVIPPMAHAPFTTMLQTEWVRILYTGGTITVVNERRVARDSNGRVYQERWLLVPKNGNKYSQTTALQISDPVNHSLATCMMDGRQVCDLTYDSPASSTVYKFEGPPTGPLPDDAGYAIHESLGNQTVPGLDTIGTRDSTIYNPGVFGNDDKVSIERELWYSPQLGLNLLSKRSDPRFGTQTFTITDLTLSEPDPQLFKLPKGFKAVDHRAVRLQIRSLRDQAFLIPPSRRAARLPKSKHSGIPGAQQCRSITNLLMLDAYTADALTCPEGLL